MLIIYEINNFLYYINFYKNVEWYVNKWRRIICYRFIDDFLYLGIRFLICRLIKFIFYFCLFYISVYFLVDLIIMIIFFV